MAPQNIKNAQKRFLSGVAGFDATGKGGIQLVNRSRNLVALYGDSLIEAATTDGKWRKAAKSEINIANCLTGQRMIFVRRRGLSGTRSDQILQRFLADVADGSLVASGAGTVIFNMGSNDIGQVSYTDVISGAAITIASMPVNIAANAARLIDTCTALGIQCVFRTLHGSTNFSAAMIAACEEANRLILALPRGRPVQILETRDLLRNPLTTTAAALTFRSGMLYDNIHPAVGGGYALGKRLAEIVRSIIPPLPASYSDATHANSANLPAQLLSNPSFTGTGGTLGGGGALGTNPAGGALTGVPTGWTASRNGSTATFTVNVGEDAAGRFVEFVITETTAGGGVYLWQTLATPATKVTAGDSIQAFATAEIVSGAVNLACACPFAEMSATVEGVTSTSQSAGAWSVGVDGSLPSTEAIVFEDATDPMAVPNFSAVGWITVRALEVRFAGAGTATVRVRKPRLEKVATAQAVAA